jgi:hypothetical protein
MKKIFLILLSVALFAACERKIDEFAPNANGVDFSKYVAVGNSMTAGYADGALYNGNKIGQDASVANIIATQLITVGNAGFTQPLIGTSDGVGFTMTPVGPYFTTKFVLKVLPSKDCAGTPVPGTESLKPALLDPLASQATLAGQLLAQPANTGPYNNMGVPGATVQTLFYPGYGSALGNPYFARFASNPMATIMDDAVVQQPTFFSLWIGNNDVLGSALAGTDALMTPVDTFAKYFNYAVFKLMNSGKTPKGVLANIPDVTSVPYFSTISKSLPYNGLVLTQDQANGLNYLYKVLYNQPQLNFVAGRNPWVITTTAGEWKQMGPNDQFLLSLPTDSMKCFGMGVANPFTQTPYPIPGRYVLESSEIANLSARVVAYNTIISAAATANNLALVNMNSNLKYFAPGMTFDGITFNLNFVSGGLFSTDGIHLCPRGNAITANYFIQAINSKYSCNIPQANITDYPGLVFP